MSFTEAIVPVVALLSEPREHPDRPHSHSTVIYRQKSAVRRDAGPSTTLDARHMARRAGYTTGFFGKYLDVGPADALSGYVPPGWDRWVAFVHSQFVDYGLTWTAGRGRSVAPQDYSTTVLGLRGPKRSSANGRARCSWCSRRRRRTGPRPPSRSTGHRSAICPPHRPPSFGDPETVQPRGWSMTIRSSPSYVDQLRRDQYRSLLSVDDQVAALLDALEDTGRLDSSLVIYTSDNGLHWGEHGWDKKETPYDEADARAVRGAGTMA